MTGGSTGSDACTKSTPCVCSGTSNLSDNWLMISPVSDIIPDSTNEFVRMALICCFAWGYGHVLDYLIELRLPDSGPIPLRNFDRNRFCVIAAAPIDSSKVFVA